MPVATGAPSCRGRAGVGGKRGRKFGRRQGQRRETPKRKGFRKRVEGHSLEGLWGVSDSDSGRVAPTGSSILKITAINSE